jgi:hypothetical protein
MMADPSDQPLEFNSRNAPDMGAHQTINISSTVPTTVSENGSVTTSTQSWGPSASVGFFPQAPVPPQPSQVYISGVYYSFTISHIIDRMVLIFILLQMDPSLHTGPLFGALSGSNYVPSAAFGVGSLTEAFPTDANPFFAERSKKVGFVMSGNDHHSLITSTDSRVRLCTSLQYLTGFEKNF